MSELDQDTALGIASDYPDTVGIRGVDSVLVNLIWFVNGLDVAVNNLSLSIVLVIPGGVLEGRLVGKATWHKAWIEMIEASGEGGQALSKGVRILREAMGRIAEDGSFIDHSGDFIHIIDGSIAGLTNRMPWRVRLDAVTAWSLGGSDTD